MCVCVCCFDQNYGGNTYRNTGATVLLEIIYDNVKEWHGSITPFYYYKPMVVKGSSYKYYEPIYGEYRQVCVRVS